jgi:two-component system, NtrC family, response regulator AtoC
MIRLQVAKALEHHRLREENRLLRDCLAAQAEFSDIVRQSAAMQPVFAQIRQVAGTWCSASRGSGGQVALQSQ